MHAYRFPSDDRVDPETLFNGQEQVKLPFGNDAFLVYSAWTNHGVTPYSGGILEQPRAFKHLLHIMNSLYAAADEDDTFMDDAFAFTLPTDEAPRSFNDFMQRG